MIQPIQLTDQVYAVKVPAGMEAFKIECLAEIDFYELDCYQLGEYNEPVKEKSISLPAGNWQVICPVKEMTRSQAGELVQWFELNGRKGYRDYAFADDLRYPFFDPISSWRSLLKAKGLDVNKNYVLIKKAS